MKKILLITSIILTLSIIVISTFNNMDNKENNIISNVEKNKQIINSNMITMMYETESGSGEYTETKDTTWPESGYIFNDVLSGCENGGELEYNSENNTVNLLSNSSDRCYVYFDKYDGVWIDNVVATNVTGSSITLDVSVTSENGSITTYYYSLNDSEEYIETTTNPIIIDDLNKLTEYNIKIYAKDNTGARSNLYELNVSTTDESKPVINSVSVSNITENGFTLTVDATSEVGISKYYFTIEGDGEQVGGTSTTNSYTFNTVGANSTYNVIVFVEDNNRNFSNEYELTVQTTGKSFASHIKDIYAVQNLNNINDIFYHNVNLPDGAKDNSYRYYGSDPSNYVCFGSTASTCPNDNLYRIIGVFNNEVKLIKNVNIGSIEWSGIFYNSSVLWRESTLNTDILNGSFLNSFNSSWQNKISNHSWKVGGMTSSNGRSTAKTAYDYEVGSNSCQTTSTDCVYSAKVGLMYVSDYGFAASPSYWDSNLSSYTNRFQDWLYDEDNYDEYTITKNNSASSSWDAVFIISDGGIDLQGVAVAPSPEVRPCFYLNSNVEYSSGNGTQSDPFRIKL